MGSSRESVDNLNGQDSHAYGATKDATNQTNGINEINGGKYTTPDAF